MLRRYLRRLGGLDVLTVALLIVAAILAALISLSVVEGGIVLAVVFALASLAPQALKWFGQQRERDRKEASLLRIRRPISEVDLFEERLVFPSALAEQDYPDQMPPYVRREADTALDEALKTNTFILITGTSKAGKSRTALEAVSRMDPEPTLLVPASPGDLPKLCDLGFPVERSRQKVLWLDDLNRYLEDPAASRALFEELAKNGSRTVMIATITWTEYERLRSSEGEIGRSTREILDLFEEAEITLPSLLSPTEREEAKRLYPSQSFDAGIGEHFAAARELIARFKAAVEENRHGFAVAVAALNWRRAGMPRPITGAELRDLYALCLKHFSPLYEASDEDYQEGVAWAREPLESQAALLMPKAEEGVEGFEVFDYLRDWSDGAGSDVDQSLHTVLEPIWHFVINRATPLEAEVVGFAAYTRGNHDAAEEAWTLEANSDDPEAAPKAAHNLGVLFAERGDYARAAKAWTKVAVSGHPDFAPHGAFNLGVLFAERGDYDRAEYALKQAIDSEHSEFAPKAAHLLHDLPSSTPE